MREVGNSLTGRLVFGIIVIALGAIFMLDNLGFIDAGSILRWWPILIVAYGLSGFFGPRSSAHLVRGLIVIGIGSWILLHTLGLVRHDAWDIWPIAMIVIGIALVSGSFSRMRSDPAGTSQSSDLHAFAFMSGTERKILAQDFRGGDVTAIMGGHVIDLRSAGLAESGATIDLFVWWGGVDVLVPPEWRVSTEALPLMGGVVDKTRPAAGEPRAHLVLRGLILMGGLEVKN